MNPADKVESWPIERCSPAARNPRTHSAVQVAQIAASIREWGWTIPLLVDEKGVLIAGHGRLLAAKKLGLKKVPVMVAAGWTEKQKRAYLLADNKLALNAGWDSELLKVELADLRELGADISIIGFADDELREILGAGADAPEPKLDQAAELQKKWRTARGQFWQIGRHRLMCGDAYDPADRNSLLAGKRPQLLHTDPPYGISIVSTKGVGGGSKPFGSTVSGGANRKSSKGFDKRKAKIIQSNVYRPIHGDDKPFDPAQFLGLAEVVVLWGANYFADKLPPSSCWVCWDKREAITRNTFADCELAWCSDDSPARIFHHLWNGIHKGSQHGERRTHPTEKPVDLFKAIGAEYAPKGTWADLFAGTCAQIIAAEQTGATCFASEIEPIYVAVALERMSEMDLKPKLAEKAAA